MGESFPRVIRDWVGVFMLSKLDYSILEQSGTDVDRVVDYGVPARTEVWVFAGPSIIGISVSNMDERGILVPVRFLCLFRVT